MWAISRTFLNVLLGAIVCRPCLAAGPGGDSEQVDELDRQELQAQLDNAAKCTSEGDFDCAAAAIAKARKYQQSARDRQAIAQATQQVELARQRVMFDDAKARYSQESSASQARA